MDHLKIAQALKKKRQPVMQDHVANGPIGVAGVFVIATAVVAKRSVKDSA